MKSKALVIGLGFAGSVLARQLADSGYEVIALERRAHIAGNMFEYERGNGVRVHLYGPHLFHTNLQHVYNYLSKFSSFYPYSHRVLGMIDKKLVPIPFNFRSIDTLFPKDIAARYKTKLQKKYDNNARIFVSDLMDNDDKDIKSLGQFILQKVFINYTAKQWGVSLDQVDASVINRVPVIVGEDDRYFSDSIQMMPLHGFTDLFNKILDHPLIQIHLNSEASRRVQLHSESGKILLDGIPFEGPVCYTGAVDELFGYALGSLPYRSTDFSFEDHAKDIYQNAAVVNYPNEESFTRITEFKHITLQDIPEKTSILKEYPTTYYPGSNMIPLYPIKNINSQKKYTDYVNLSKKYSDLFLCGRLADYKYYNMDSVIERALSVAEEIISSPKYK